MTKSSARRGRKGEGKYCPSIIWTLKIHPKLSRTLELERGRPREEGLGPELETGEELGLVLANQPPEGLGPEAGAALGRSTTMPKTGHQGEEKPAGISLFSFLAVPG